MKSHDGEGLHFRRERRFVIDPRNGRRRSIILHVVAIAGGGLVSGVLLALML